MDSIEMSFEDEEDFDSYKDFIISRLIQVDKRENLFGRDVQVWHKFVHINDFDNHIKNIISYALSKNHKLQVFINLLDKMKLDKLQIYTHQDFINIVSYDENLELHDLITVHDYVQMPVENFEEVVQKALKRVDGYNEARESKKLIDAAIACANPPQEPAQMDETFKL